MVDLSKTIAAPLYREIVKNCDFQERRFERPSLSLEKSQSFGH
jgi:hypothetical protein